MKKQIAIISMIICLLVGLFFGFLFDKETVCPQIDDISTEVVS